MSLVKILRNLLCIILCCGLLSTVTFADAGTFPDVPDNADYFDAVETLAELGIVRGDDYGYFNPDSTITRAEAATMICRLLEVEDDALSIRTASFSDVPATHWAVGYVTKCVELGIINGLGDGNFGPDDPVTYEQMVKMLVCAWGYEDMAVEAGGWPDGYMDVAKQVGITTDLEDGTATRAVVAKLFFNVLVIAPADFTMEH